MPPAMRTLPSGKRVALWPERGSSIGVAGVSEPAAEAVEADTVVELVRNAEAAKTKMMVMIATRRNRERRMGVLLASQTHGNGSREQTTLRITPRNSI